jgi:hypothetical protein
MDGKPAAAPEIAGTDPLLAILLAAVAVSALALLIFVSIP